MSSSDVNAHLPIGLALVVFVFNVLYNEGAGGTTKNRSSVIFLLNVLKSFKEDWLVLSFSSITF
jgi:hypothetical protein